MLAADDAEDDEEDDFDGIFKTTAGFHAIPAMSNVAYPSCYHAYLFFYFVSIIFNTCSVIFKAGGKEVLIFCGPHALYRC